MAQLDDKTLQNLNKRLKEMDEILASDYRKALDLGKAFTQGFSTEQIDAFLRKLGKINRADAAKLNVMFNLVDVNGKPITIQEARTRIKQIMNAINKGQASTSISGTKIIGLGSMTNELKRYKDALSVLGMSTSQQFDLISRNVKKVNNEVKGLRKGFGDMLPTLQRLASAFGVAFSVRGLAQFGKKLIETRGEFEMQFVAMKQIIGDVDAATKIWNQTMQQALQSPFKAMQLVTYTKQLAAYRIETEKLFDTTKRLADISAGLGVDMGRLILAYGQVKSANFLRASEVRQFTEAGVNIAGGLAKYFTELEGRMVGTAEVMERITKRMVLFSDVEEVFKRMTDEGGEFFNMQEVQADTVKGQIMKLHDAYDQMLNTIGQANQGVIRNFVDRLNDLVRNWQNVAYVLKWNVNWVTAFGAALFALSNKYLQGATTQTLWFSKALTGNSGVLLKEVGAVRLFGNEVGILTMKQRLGVVAMRSFQGAISAVGSVLRRFWPLIVFEGIVLLTERLTRASRELKRFREELESIASDNVDRMNEEINGYDSLIKKLKETTEGTMARKEVMDEISRRYGKYLDFIVTEKTTVEELADAYDKVVTSIRNYTAEKIREEQQQKLEKGMYEAYQDLIGSLTGEKFWDSEGGISHKITKSQAQNIAKIVQQSLQEYGVADIQNILSTYFGESYKYAFATGGQNQGVINEIRTYVSQWKDLKDELNEIRDDIEGTTPVFASEAEYEAYKRNVEAASEALLQQNKEYEEQVRLTKETLRDTSEQWIIDDKIAKLRLENEEKVLQIRKEYGLISEGQYNDELARLQGVLDTYEKDYNKRLETAMISQYGIFWQTTNKEARDMYNYVVSTEQALQQGTSQRNKQLKESYKGFKESLEQYNAQYQAAVNSSASKESLDKIQADIDFATLMMKAIELAAQLRGIDLSDKKTHTRTTHENASKLISLIKEMRSEYDKLSKSAYGYAKSEEKVRESYRDSVKEILGKAGVTKDYDFTTNEGMIAALNKVLVYANKLGKDAAAEVQKYIDQLETEIEINAQVRIREDFGKQMEKAFNDYELTLELDKLNISPEAAKDWLNFDYTSLGDMLNAMNDFANKLIEKNDFDEEDAKIYQQWAKKIEDQIYKARKEKAKEYSKYLETELSERAKLEMEYAKKVAEVKASPVFQGEQQDAILNNMNREFNEKLQELTWKSFKESDFYVEMMEDLTSIPAEYSALMLTKLNEILMHPEKLSPRALKEAINARQKIMEARRQMNPALAMSENLRSYREFYTNQGNRDEFGLSAKTSRAARKEIQALIIDKSKELSQLEEEINIYDDLIGEIENYNNLKKEYDEKSQGLAGDPEEEISQRQELLECLEYEQQRYEDLRDAKQRGEEIDEEEFNSLAKEINVRQQNIIQLNAEIKAYREAEVARKALGTAYANLSENAQNLVGGGEIQIGSTSGITSGNIKSKRQATADKKDNTKSAIQRLKDARKNEVEFAKAWHEFNAQLNDTIGKVKNMGNAFYDTFDALGGETDALTEGWKEFGSTMIDAITSALTMIPTLVTGFTAAGVAINSAMGIIGLIAEAIQLVLVLITGLAKLNDAGYEAEIERQQKKIDDLQRAYDRLEKQIEKTWDTASYIRTYNEATLNLYAQIEALNKQIAAENAKKETDADKIQGYKDSIRDAEDELEELKQEQIEVFGGIGKEGYRDTAQEFVDAWKSAFLETGDGLQGLQEHFDEFLNDWFVKQATMRYASAALEPVFKMIDDAVDPNGAGGANVVMQELEAIKEWARVNFPRISDTLEEISRPFIGDGEGSLSGLAAGIQGMTEEQANILEAYWNSVRGYTASIDQNVAKLLSNDVNTNPMLNQMTLVAQNTNNIRTLLESVRFNGGEGVGIRVYSY